MIPPQTGQLESESGESAADEAALFVVEATKLSEPSV
jgi:hypothetical protein